MFGPRTIGIYHVIKHGLICLLIGGWEIQYNLIIGPHELLYLYPIIPFQEGSDGPHDGKDVQVFVVGLADRACVLVILGWDQSLQEFTGLRNDESLQDFHFEGQILNGITQHIGEGPLKQIHNDGLFIDRA